MKHLRVFLLVSLLAACGRETPVYEGEAFLPMRAERLPDLTVPRGGHGVRIAGGELTVFGGHTTGFIPTATAEYYKRGRWHLMEMVYPHDFGTVTGMDGGDVLLLGGCEAPLGVGQTAYAESYDPHTHRFRPRPELDWRCCLSSAAFLADGTAVVSGNWFGEDRIVGWSPVTGQVDKRVPSVERSSPVVLPTGPDDAIIFGVRDNRNRPLADSLAILVDRYRGEPFEEPLLSQWRPFSVPDNAWRMDRVSIGDPGKGEYRYLVAAYGPGGEPGLLYVDGDTFSRLETDRPLPATGIDGNPISWTQLMTEKDSGRAWMAGATFENSRVYLARIDYGEARPGERVSVRLFQTHLPDVGPIFEWTLLEGGRVVLVGGSRDNYEPGGAVIILHTEPKRRRALPMSVAVLLLAATGAFLAGRRIRRRPAPVEAPAAERPDERTLALMEKIRLAMEQDELFRRQGLTKEDLARAVFSNSRYVSDCINAVAGCSFIDYVNGYRIRYAQRLLRERPGMRLQEVIEEAGFSSEVTFYRHFKARTGQTPSEWLSSGKDGQ